MVLLVAERFIHLGRRINRYPVANAKTRIDLALSMRSSKGFMYLIIGLWIIWLWPPFMVRPLFMKAPTRGNTRKYPCIVSGRNPRIGEPAPALRTILIASGCGDVLRAHPLVDVFAIP